MLLERMIRAARLDPNLYYEVQRDRNAIGQAFLVVLIVAACAWFQPSLAILNPITLFFAAVAAIGGWLMMSVVSILVAGRLGGRAEFEDVMRAIAFTYAPGVLQILALLPRLDRPVGLVVWAWTTLAAVVAIREVFRFNTRQAVLTVVFTTLIMGVICYLTHTTYSTVDRVVSLVIR